MQELEKKKSIYYIFLPKILQTRTLQKSDVSGLNPRLVANINTYSCFVLNI